MARCKSSPEVVRTKCELAHRLKAVRTEQYGERGGPELARRLNLPIRTWYNYETGVTVPSEVLLRFIELTSVEPRWLLHGEGPKYRRTPPFAPDDGEPGRLGQVPELLRRALSLLEVGADYDGDEAIVEVEMPPTAGPDPHVDRVVVHVEESESGGPPHNGAQPTTLPLKRDWLAGSRRFRCLRVRGDAMAPLLADGAVVGVAERPEEPEALNGALVAARIDDRSIVRWLQVAGHVVLLRAEDPTFEPEVVSNVSMNGSPESWPFRRVLWTYTPHGSTPPWSHP